MNQVINRERKKASTSTERIQLFLGKAKDIFYGSDLSSLHDIPPEDSGNFLNTFSESAEGLRDANPNAIAVVTFLKVVEAARASIEEGISPENGNQHAWEMAMARKLELTTLTILEYRGSVRRLLEAKPNEIQAFINLARNESVNGILPPLDAPGLIPIHIMLVCAKSYTDAMRVGREIESDSYFEALHKFVNGGDVELDPSAAVTQKLPTVGTTVYEAEEAEEAEELKLEDLEELEEDSSPTPPQPSNRNKATPPTPPKGAKRPKKAPEQAKEGSGLKLPPLPSRRKKAVPPPLPKITTPQTPPPTPIKIGELPTREKVPITERDPDEGLTNEERAYKRAAIRICNGGARLSELRFALLELEKPAQGEKYKILYVVSLKIAISILEKRENGDEPLSSSEIRIFQEEMKKAFSERKALSDIVAA